LQIVGYLVSKGRTGVRAPKKKASVARKRTDKRSQVLLYMQPDLVRRLKLAALAKGQPAYELAEEAIDEWLKRHQRDVGRATAAIARGDKI
jgi:hypothetical protein